MQAAPTEEQKAAAGKKDILEVSVRAPKRKWRPCQREDAQAIGVPQIFVAKPATTFPRAGWLAGGKSRLRGCRGRGSRESGKPTCAVFAECSERGFSCVTSSLRCHYMREAQLVAAVGFSTWTIALSLRECVPLLLCNSV